MSISEEEYLPRWFRVSINELQSARNLTAALEMLAENICIDHPETKIWFVERFGQREAFLAGAGSESFSPAERLEINKHYALFAQDLHLTEREQRMLITLAKLLLVVFTP